MVFHFMPKLDYITSQISNTNILGKLTVGNRISDKGTSEKLRQPNNTLRHNTHNL